MFFAYALLRKFHSDNAFFLARALAFDVLVCLIPALFLLFLLFGFVFDSSDETVRYMTLYMMSMIPFSSAQLLKILFMAVKAQKILSLVGIIGLFWTLSRVFSSTRTVLNVVFDIKKARGVIAGKFLDLKMIFLCSLFFLATVLITFLSSFLKSLSPHVLGIKIFYLGIRGELISLLLAFFSTVCMFYLLYKFMPNRKIQTKIAFFGALSAGFLWELAKQGFRLYFFNVVDLNKFYGSFGLLLALVLWVYYSCIVFILGAEVGLIWQSRSPDGEGPEASF